MTRVYRFQDAEGRGPYKPGMRAKWGDPDHDARGLPPFFVEFGMSVIEHKRRGHLGCAFVSLEQARRWFTPTEVMRMQRLGYELVQIEAEIVARSDNQCVVVSRVPFARAPKQVVPAEELWPLIVLRPDAARQEGES